MAESPPSSSSSPSTPPSSTPSSPRRVLVTPRRAKWNTLPRSQSDADALDLELYSSRAAVERLQSEQVVDNTTVAYELEAVAGGARRRMRVPLEEVPSAENGCGKERREQEQREQEQQKKKVDLVVLEHEEDASQDESEEDHPKGKAGQKERRAQRGLGVWLVVVGWSKKLIRLDQRAKNAEELRPRARPPTLAEYERKLWKGLEEDSKGTEDADESEEIGNKAVSFWGKVAVRQFKENGDGSTWFRDSADDLDRGGDSDSDSDSDSGSDSDSDSGSDSDV